MQSLECISKKISDFTHSSGDKIEGIEVKPGKGFYKKDIRLLICLHQIEIRYVSVFFLFTVQYFYAQDVLNHLEKTDATKDFFGRASASVRVMIFILIYFFYLDLARYCLSL